MRRTLLIAAAVSLAACVASVARREQQPAPVAASARPGQDSPRTPDATTPPISPESSSDARSLKARLAAAAPGVNPVVLDLALKARTCAIRRGAATPASRLAVIDYSRPSTQRRLWVFDVRQPRLLFDEYVAHGRGSGDNFARQFSNVDGSLASSLGLFATAETYVGGKGYALRMDGLEPGVNDRARSRALVMHGAWYVDPLLALKQGRLGRSQGCPALRPQVTRAVIDSLKQGQLLFAYYPDRAWLAHSRFLDCNAPTAAAESR